MRRIWAVFALLMASSFVCQAQDPPDFLQSLRPYDTLHGGDIDSVSLTTGDWSLRVPLWSFPQRGGKLTLDFHILANSQKFWLKENCGPTGENCTGWTMRRVAGNKLRIAETQSAGTTQKNCKPTPTDSYALVYVTTPAGSKHLLGDIGGGKKRTIDGTGFLITANNELVSREGIRWSGSTPTTREDSNGNRITYSPNVGWTDTLGRFIPDPAAATSTTDYTACTGPRPITSATVWNLPAVGGGTASIKRCFASVTIKTRFGAPAEYTATLTLIQSIVLPNGTAWTFEYEDRNPGDSSDPSNPAYANYGNITKVTFPTGGSISYVYQNFSPTGDYGRAPVSRTINDGLGQSAAWTYSWTTDGQVNPAATALVRDPLGNETQIQASGGYETLRRIYQGSLSSGTLLRTVATDTVSAVTLGSPGPFGACVAIWSYARLPIRATTTLDNGLVEKDETDYDTGFTFYGYNGGAHTAKYGSPIEKRDYGFGLGLVRRNSITYLAFTDSTYLNNNLLDLPVIQTIANSSGATSAQTTYSYDQYALVSSGVSTQLNTNPATGSYRGNPTAVSRCLNTTGGYLTTTNKYYDTGTLERTTDPGVHTTTFAYSLAFAGAYLTQTTSALSQVASRNYDFNTGLIVSVTDPNSQMSTFSYDTMSRPDIANFPDGGQIDRDYDDTNRIVTIKAKRTTGGAYIYKKHIYDQLGRIIQEQLCEDGTANCAQSIKTDTTYDAAGRKSTVTNPYRTTSDSTYGSTTFVYDALSRPIKVKPPDGNLNPDSNIVTTTFSGSCTTVTDQAGKIRKSCTDALGRLIQVFEPNSSNSLIYETDYQYDVLDNLTRVDQKGNDPNSANWRTRTFTYNSLSQLTQANNPESGTINYTYDADGSLLTKVSPAPNQTGSATVTLSYCYDALHRLTTKAYTAQTCPMSSPVATYSYDQTSFNGLTIANGIGRRTGMTDAAGLEAWSYDVMGHVQTDRRTTNNVTKDFGYSYNPDGSAATLAYPSGRTITYAYDNAGRAASGTDQTNGINYALNASYAPHGALATMQNGASIVSTFYYNNRLQPCRISVKSSGTAPTQCSDATFGNVLDFTYSFNLGTANNGNVASIANNRDANRTQIFAYDELNRLASAQTNSNLWGNTYVYDVWANLLQKNQIAGKTQGEYLQQSVNEKNKIVGFCYDSAGNLLLEVACPQPLGVLTYSYDAENRMTQSVVSGLTTNYLYDGDGKRAKRDQTNGSAHRLHWYGTGADPLEESDLSGSATADYIFFGGKRTARQDLPAGAVHYFFSDHLGSASVVTNAGGTTNEEESDYYPWGRERVIADTLPDQNYKFTGKERDTESGLDEFGARYNGSTIGRFLSVDASRVSINQTNPQSWNRYAYVLNNPLGYVDRNGLWPTWVHNEMIQSTFGGVLPQRQVNLLMTVSHDVDWSNRGQNPNNSNRHSMCAPGQSVQDCTLGIDAGVRTNIRFARVSQSVLPRDRSSISDVSIGYFGMAAHTLTDMGSPEHLSPDGTPITWANGFKEGASHFFGEIDASVDWAAVGQSIRNLIAGFIESYPAYPVPYRSADAWAQAAISNMVSRHFAASMLASRGDPSVVIAEEAARQCALGNPAACRD